MLRFICSLIISCSCIIHSTALAEVQKNIDESKEEEPERLDPIDKLEIGTDLYPGTASDELALIIFAVVGVATVVAWVPYFPVLAYKASKKDDGVNSFNLLGVNHNFNMGSPDGMMSGLNFGHYLNEGEYPETHYGFLFEVGHYQLQDNGSTHHMGEYWFVGPSLIYGKVEKDNLYGRLNLLGGSTFDSSFGLITKAELSGHYMFSDFYSVGLSLGGMYVNLKGDEGIISRPHHLGITLGLSLNAKF